MSDSPQTASEVVKMLEELPLWFVILLAFASGFSGELWRASKNADISWGEIIKRVCLRLGASVMFGFATFLLALYMFSNMIVAVFCCIVIALLGADVVSVIYERAAARQLANVDLGNNTLSDKDTQ